MSQQSPGSQLRWLGLKMASLTGLAGFWQLAGSFPQQSFIIQNAEDTSQVRAIFPKGESDVQVLLRTVDPNPATVTCHILLIQTQARFKNMGGMDSTHERHVVQSHHKSVYSETGEFVTTFPVHQRLQSTALLEHLLYKLGSATPTFITQGRWPNHSKTRSTRLENKHSCFEDLVPEFT